MSEIELNESICESCGHPLFLDIEECKSFIEKRMKEGFLVCSCCEARTSAKKNPVRPS